MFVMSVMFVMFVMFVMSLRFLIMSFGQNVVGISKVVGNTVDQPIVEEQ